MKKVTDNPNLRRDENNSAIINVDATGYRAARQRKALRGVRENRLTKLETEMKEIKDMLTLLVNK